MLTITYKMANLKNREVVTWSRHCDLIVFEELKHNIYCSVDIAIGRKTARAALISFGKADLIQYPAVAACHRSICFVAQAYHSVTNLSIVCQE